MIIIQEKDFDQQHEFTALKNGGQSGAIVTFVGLVRDFSDNPDAELYLQHYPAMTEKVLHEIAEQARQNWPLHKVRIVHRVGRLQAGEQIVFVGVSSAHRKAAFEACQFIMDILKTQAPFWKKEGDSWVEAKSSDQHAANDWLKKV